MLCPDLSSLIIKPAKINKKVISLQMHMNLINNKWKKIHKICDIIRGGEEFEQRWIRGGFIPYFM
jgi:hypothetical protein